MLMRRLRLHMPVAMQVRPAASDPLEISDLKVWALREPVSGRRYTVLRADTKSGVKGYGECGEIGIRDLGEAKRIAMGGSASAYETTWRRLSDVPRLRAAINMAQLDILGQAAKAPTYQVLGGPTRNKARAFTALEGAAGLERAQKSGFKAFAVPTPANPWRNAGKPYVEQAVTLMQRMRRATSADADFVLDGGGRLVTGDAQTLAAELEKSRLLWFEEPCRLSNLGAVKKISAESVTPLGFGRALTEPGDFQNLLREDCVDILRPDLAKHGISQIRRIAAIGEVYYIAVAPYHDGGPIATAAALHLAASIPNFFIQQVPTPPDPKDQEMRKAIAGEVETVSNGFLSLPTGPGLGIRVNEEALDRYQERG